MIDSIRLPHYDEQFAPPAQPVLELTLVGDCLHLIIAEYDEDSETATSTILAAIGVDIQQFDGAIRLLVDDQVQQRVKAEVSFQDRYVCYAE